MNGEAVQPPGDGSLKITNQRKRARFFQAVDWLSFAITSLLVLGVYLWTLAPNVTLGLSAIYCVGATYAAVPHPPGYPLWTIYGWLFTVLLPVSNIAWRVAVSSAVAGALTCGLIALMTSRGAGLVAENLPSTLKPKQIALLRILSGYLAGASFGFNGTFWQSAVAASPWPFSLLLFAITLCFLMKWFHLPERSRWLCFGCLFYGFAVTNSQALFSAALGLQLLIMFGKPAVGRDMLFGNLLLALVAAALYFSNGLGGLVPAWPEASLRLTVLQIVLVTISIVLCVGAIIKTRGFLSESKRVLAAVLMFASGLMAYFYVPLASMTNPPINWSYARTVSGFFHSLTRGQYERLNPIHSVGRFFEVVWSYLEVTIRDFGGIYLILAVIPLLLLRRTQAQARRWHLGLLIAYACFTVVMLIGMNPAPDRQSIELSKVFFSASYLMLAILAGYGATFLACLLAAPRTENCRSPGNEAQISS